MPKLMLTDDSWTLFSWRTLLNLSFYAMSFLRRLHAIGKPYPSALFIWFIDFLPMALSIMLIP
ncbi:hypothetical protein UA24_08665 [Marinomonas sp. BSi20414]|nr:hypothetical protein [Marinomonas sp. BSi20414]